MILFDLNIDLKKDEMRQQNKNFVSNVFETAELLSFQRKTRMRRYKGARREAKEWEDYCRIHYIAASWFHAFPRASIMLASIRVYSPV
jgi:hypothetical protein